jgi:hypothetical protein
VNQLNLGPTVQDDRLSEINKIRFK